MHEQYLPTVNYLLCFAPLRPQRKYSLTDQFASPPVITPVIKKKKAVVQNDMIEYKICIQ